MECQVQRTACARQGSLKSPATFVELQVVWCGCRKGYKQEWSDLSREGSKNQIVLSLIYRVLLSIKRAFL